MKQEKTVLLILTLIFLCTLPFFYLHQGLLLVDTGREFYIPQQMLNGGVLFKDIFNIYGALSYQINAVLFMLFGVKIDTLAAAGAVNSFIIIITVYLTAREFLNKSLSFLSALFIMYALVFASFLYNSNLAYCFAAVYALSAFMLSLLLLIKYTKTKKSAYAYSACFFAGVSFACKYEFLLYSLVLIYTLRNSGVKNGLKASCCTLAAPFISTLALFLQSLDFDDVKNAAGLIYNLITAPLIRKFFLNIQLSVIEGGAAAVFAPLIIVNAVLFLLNFKEIKKNEPLLIFLLSAFAACPKSFLCLNINHMGVFLLPVSFLAFVILINNRFKTDKILLLLLSALVFIFAAQDFAALKDKNYLLKTNKGSIYAYKKDGMLIKEAVSCILENTKPEDRVLVMPEGAVINFITDRKGDNTYYNLSPLFYYDVFGEERILKHFKTEPAEWIIILPIDNIEYGFRYFGKDYAQKFYSFILENYTVEYSSDKMKIFKHRDYPAANN